MMILTKNEKEIMDLLWTMERPLTRMEIIEFSVNKSWKSSSIHILLNQLLEKDAIKVEGYVRTGKNFGRTYTFNLTEQQYQVNMFKSGVVYERGTEEAVAEFIRTLLEGEVLSSAVAENIKFAVDAQVQK